MGSKCYWMARLGYYRGAKMATRTMKGTYVKSEITDIMRHRNRQDLASTKNALSTANTNKCSVRTLFNLRIVQCNRLLRICTANTPCHWDAPERSDPPDREENESNEEAPSVKRRAIFIFRSEPQ